jgi:hypothetical protein
MDLFLVYLWLKLDAVSDLFIIFSILATICAFVTGFIKLAGEDLSEEVRLRVSKVFKYSSILLFVLSFTIALMPSTKQTAVLVGVHYANKFVESPEGAKVQTLIKAKANQLLDEQIKNLEKKN